jgi:putative tricarboxylic transport membrane protein
VVTKEVHGLWPSKEDLKRIWAPVLRGTALGSVLGILPGGAVLFSFGSYTIEKKLSKTPERFGTKWLQRLHLEGIAIHDLAQHRSAIQDCALAASPSRGVIQLSQ